MGRSFGSALFVGGHSRKIRRQMRTTLLFGIAIAAFGWTNAASPPDCSAWTLDGYRLGMRGDELLAVRSVTLHVEGQAQASEPGKFSGVLILDALNRLQKWDVLYHAENADALRAELQERHGNPVSDVSGILSSDEASTVRQRRTIWRSAACDAAIILYENASVRGTSVHSVHATLEWASALRPGLIEMKTLFPDIAVSSVGENGSVP